MPIQSQYDVIIIGAGPGGLSCAATLAASNLSVLLIDRKKEIGPKPCGGLMTSRGFSLLKGACSSVSTQTVSLHLGKRTQEVPLGKRPLHVIDRTALAKALLNRIQGSANITLRTGTPVAAISEKEISIGNEHISCRYLVGADGANSLTRRYLGIPTRARGLGFHYRLPTSQKADIDLSAIHIFLDRNRFGPWYAWVLPNPSFVSLGTGGDASVFPMGKLRKHFDRFVASLGIDPSTAPFEAGVISYDYQGLESGNCFLVGEAAGLVHGITGEGIYPALISGTEVGKKILDPHYKISIADILRTKKAQDRLARLLAQNGPLAGILHHAASLAVRLPSSRERVLSLLA
ncbi:MAG TPA: NAD(P)/FAD-dependent oxidoreductase [bacterium]|nr:NAD(P)/FAD-dependent oxidoreductase [bacterium]